MSINKLYENQTLAFICNAINIGAQQEKDLKTLNITSKNKPGFVIKPIELDIRETVGEYIQANNEILKNNNTLCETTMFDYIVFKLVENGGEHENKYTLINMSLFELVLSSKTLMKDEETNKHTDSNVWSLDSKDWDLTEVI